MLFNKNLIIILLIYLFNLNAYLLCFEMVFKFNQKELTKKELNEFSDKYGFKYKGRLFDDYYIFASNKTNYKFKRSISNDHNLTSMQLFNLKLKQDPFITWFEVQKKLTRIKRDMNYYDDENRVNEEEDEFVFNYSHKNNKFKYVLEEELFDDNYFYNLKSNIKCSHGSFYFNDPLWINQWYINDGCAQGFSLNISKAWMMGFTGKDVIVSIIDDGLEKNNIELVDNYDQNASYDLNDNDHDPQPRYDDTNENKHGTRCAGEIVAKPNNSFCGVGIAFNSRIGGIRLLDGKITDRLEAEALTFNYDYIDIFSASWGPLDDGKTVDGPGLLSKQAFINGIKFGRKGKGIIYVWAAGNGGRFNDNCNCDGYISSIYTITIGSVTQDGEMPTYSERCSAILASTFSSGNKVQSGIITSDLHNGCTKRHTGTSASAPIGAGIIALALEANKNLTWRDIQYLIICSSNPYKLKATDWRKNGVGKIFSHNYGYGLMNAGKMTELALKWPIIGEQLSCEVSYFGFKNLFSNELYRNNKLLIKRKSFRLFSIVYNDKNNCNNNLNYLEHVISKITLVSGIRGKIKINLISSSKTKSNLLEYRENDLSKKGFKSWPFMSVHFWGETPMGKWTLEIINNSQEDIYLKEWILNLYGTEKIPHIFLKD